MRLFVVFFLFSLVACQNKQVTVKPVVKSDDILYFMNSDNFFKLEPDYIFDLSFYNKLSTEYSSRLDQLSDLLGVFGYTVLPINYDLKAMPPSYYLLNRQKLSVRSFLNLTKPVGSFVVVDPDKKTLFFSNTKPAYTDIDDSWSDVVAYDIGSNDADVGSGELSLLDDVSGSYLVDNNPDTAVIKSDNEYHLDIADGNVFEVASVSSNSEPIKLSHDVVVIDQSISLQSGTSLLDCFNLISQKAGLSLNISMSENEWFLDSVISNNYTFENKTDAINALVAESNMILELADLDFRLGVSDNNNILEVLSE